MEELFFNKKHFPELLFVDYNVALQLLSIFAADRSSNLIQTFLPCLPVDNKEEEPLWTEIAFYSKISPT